MTHHPDKRGSWFPFACMVIVAILGAGFTGFILGKHSEPAPAACDCKACSCNQSRLDDQAKEIATLRCKLAGFNDAFMLVAVKSNGLQDRVTVLEDRAATIEKTADIDRTEVGQLALRVVALESRPQCKCEPTPAKPAPELIPTPPADKPKSVVAPPSKFIPSCPPIGAKP